MPTWSGNSINWRYAKLLDRATLGKNLLDSSLEDCHNTPYRVWSLWELLTESAHAYVHIGHVLAHLKLIAKGKAGGDIDEPSKDHYVRFLEEINLPASRLPVSTKCITRLAEQIKEGRLKDYYEISIRIDALESTVFDELRSFWFFSVPLDREQAFDRINLKYQTVKWQECSKELSRSAMAYLVGLGTASVFHSMRCADKCLGAVAASLGVEYARENWQNVIEGIEKKIREFKNLPKGSDKEWKETVYSEIATEFTYIKNAWRNHTMHARSNYDLEEAETIYEHVWSLQVKCEALIEHEPVAQFRDNSK